MNQEIIPFSPPRVDDKMIKEVVDTLKSGWITTGPKTKKLESKLTEYAGHKRTLCLNSASAGLELILRWYGVGVGDEVILPAYTYAATANVIIHTGAKPVFVDISSDFNIDVEKIKEKITSKTKVIMPVDIGGFPADYKSINSIVADEKIKKLFSPQTENQKKLGRILILSDAAHSIGASVDGIKTGSLTDISVYSFHAVKNLTTAEGGAICINLPSQFNADEVYNELNIKSLHGQNKDALAKTQSGKWRYDIVEAGYKCNMTDIVASLGLIEIERYDKDTLVKRKYVFDKYTEAFKKYDWAITPKYETENIKSSYHVYMLRLNGFSEVYRDKVIENIFQKNVCVNVHFIPLPMMSYYKQIGYSIADTPNAFIEYSREISLPVYYDLTDQQIDRVIDAVVKSVEEVKQQKQNNG